MCPAVPSVHTHLLRFHRGRRPAVERSGTNALGVRRPISAAAPRCEAPSGRGLSAQPTGGEKNAWQLSLRQRFALPPPSQREARGIHIPLRGGTHGSRPTGCGVLQWSAAEQMPLGYDVPSRRRKKVTGIRRSLGFTDGTAACTPRSTGRRSGTSWRARWTDTHGCRRSRTPAR